MSKRLTAFSAWCAFLIILAGIATWFAWSPFSDDERPGGDDADGQPHRHPRQQLTWDPGEGRSAVTAPEHPT